MVRNPGVKKGQEEAKSSPRKFRLPSTVKMVFISANFFCLGFVVTKVTMLAFVLPAPIS